jgi:hypothetical protein
LVAIAGKDAANQQHDNYQQTLHWNTVIQRKPSVGL